jgi:hypothetical protein
LIRTAALGVVLGLALGACRIANPFATNRKLTGTCDGACDHYLDCKDAGGAAAKQACVEECRDVFHDAESIRAFESLDCRDTIEYVEGPSGRGPGTMVGQPDD